MNLTLALPPLVLFIGLIFFWKAKDSKMAEVGRIMFACGFLIMLWMMANHSLHVSF